MRAINIHKRIIDQPKSKVVELFATLATEKDMMLATDKWPPMKLDKGLQLGSKGGHGSIEYTVIDYHPEEFIEFEFSKPEGFIGIHKFEITELENERTELKHTNKMNTSGIANFIWPFAIRWLHDAYIEDAFDKVENHFTAKKKRTEWNFWVKFLRKKFNQSSNERR